MAVMTVRDKVLAGNKKFMAAFSQKDAAGVAKLYTKSGQLLPPGRDAVAGRPAIEAFWQRDLEPRAVREPTRSGGG